MNQAAPLDGIWGLGFASQSEANRLLQEEGGAPTLLDNLAAQGLIDAKRFSFRLARKAGEPSEFVLGREPRSYEPSGGWAWTEIVAGSQLQIAVQKISVGGGSLFRFAFGWLFCPGLRHHVSCSLVARVHLPFRYSSTTSARNNTRLFNLPIGHSSPTQARRPRPASWAAVRP